MEKTNTVIINGRHYDPKTGLPVAAPSKKKAAKPSAATPKAVNHPTAAAAIHAAPQRSQTLNRRVVKKLAPKPKQTLTPTRSTVASKVHASAPQKGRTMDIARNGRITRFAAQTVAAPKAAVSAIKDHAPVSHPMAARAMKRTHRNIESRPINAGLTKEQAIEKVLATPSPSREPHKKPSFWHRHKRIWVLIGIVLVVVLVGGYTTLVNLPGISVAFAAHQSGIKASYPGFTPDGYSLQQPVTFSEGQVTLNFISNGGGKGYIINESRSSWDSSAVLVNVVQKAAGSNYITTQDSGLTIYSYNSNAAWVNAGILYTITTQAPLTSEQVRDIATSL